MMKHTTNKRKKRQTRIRARIHGTPDRPRLNIFRSNKYLYAQIINDEEGKTMVSIHSKAVNDRHNKENQKNVILARYLGKTLAEKAQKHKINAVIFDRGGFRYHGRVAAFADGAREGGLKF